ncbi:hypothetical protein AK812_SmicGene49065 [Symbiodinium microadriaticum]|uniref:Uncharacterized protein n=1 Tax=Symbiodinium microadriaticum TaxID=2951 RepID=A0A1Q9DD35_SYMMI|nr:hypothetical protein AK812_SmicGene49065 [Symbiodinium microadriaticum]
MPLLLRPLATGSGKLPCSWKIRTCDLSRHLLVKAVKGRSHRKASGHASGTGGKSSPRNSAKDRGFGSAQGGQERRRGRARRARGLRLRADIGGSWLDLDHHGSDIDAQLLQPLMRIVTKREAKRLPAATNGQAGGLGPGWVDKLLVYHLVAQRI